MRLVAWIAMPLALAAVTAPAGATNGYQLIGVGSSQVGLGGAVTAVPQDAMTAISNPAGIARIGERADFNMEAFLPTRSVDFSGPRLGGAETEGGSEMYGIPSIGWVARAFGSESIYFGGGMYATSGLGVDYGELTFMPGAALDQMAGAPAGTFADVTFDGYSAIQFWKIAPAIAWQAEPRLTLGFALNADYQSVTIREAIRAVPFWNNPQDPQAGLTPMDVRLDLGRPTNQFGLGATLGALYAPHPLFTLGGAYTSKQSFGDAEFRVGAGDVSNFNGAVGLPGIYKLNLDFPQMAAFGVALHPTHGLTIAADVKWINWSQTHDEVTLRGPAGAFDTNGDRQGDAEETKLAFGWEDQTIFATGVQYQATPALTLRAGFNYARAPIDERDVFNNLILPATVEQHYTAGFHYNLGEHWGLGAAAMIATEKKFAGRDDVPAGFQMMTPFEADSGAEISLAETSLDVQLSYRF